MKSACSRLTSACDRYRDKAFCWLHVPSHPEAALVRIHRSTSQRDLADVNEGKARLLRPLTGQHGYPGPERHCQATEESSSGERSDRFWPSDTNSNPRIHAANSPMALAPDFSASLRANWKIIHPSKIALDAGLSGHLS
jgi:hypothetical protein